MKLKILGIVCALSIFNCVPLVAGSITDTYTNGDTLTATMLENIKSAVNDNDARISATQTRYLSLPGTACFRNPAAPPYYISNRGLYCTLSNQAGTSIVEAIWPVDIPNGATILGLRAHVYSGSGTITCTLRSGTNNSGTNIGEVTDTNTPNWHNTAETVISHVVDTTNSAYYVICTADTASTQNVIGHIRIQYTF